MPCGDVGIASLRKAENGPSRCLLIPLSFLCTMDQISDKCMPKLFKVWILWIPNNRSELNVYPKIQMCVSCVDVYFGNQTRCAVPLRPAGTHEANIFERTHVPSPAFTQTSACVSHASRNSPTCVSRACPKKTECVCCEPPSRTKSKSVADMALNVPIERRLGHTEAVCDRQRAHWERALLCQPQNARKPTVPFRLGFV